MGYLGRSSVVGKFYKVDNTFTGNCDGSRQTFPLTYNGAAFSPSNTIRMVAVQNGKVLQPTTDFTVSGSSITYRAAPYANVSPTFTRILSPTTSKTFTRIRTNIVSVRYGIANPPAPGNITLSPPWYVRVADTSELLVGMYLSGSGWDIQTSYITAINSSTNITINSGNISSITGNITFTEPNGPRILRVSNTTDITANMYVNGTGFANNTVTVTKIHDGTNVSISAANTSAISGTISFTNPKGYLMIVSSTANVYVGQRVSGTGWTTDTVYVTDVVNSTNLVVSSSNTSTIGSTVTFSDKIFITVFGESINIGTPSDGVVTNEKFIDNTIEYDKLSTNAKEIIIGQQLIFGF
jgi:hypothetical protein